MEIIFSYTYWHFIQPWRFSNSLPQPTKQKVLNLASKFKILSSIFISINKNFLVLFDCMNVSILFRKKWLKKFNQLTSMRKILIFLIITYSMKYHFFRSIFLGIGVIIYSLLVCSQISNFK